MMPKDLDGKIALVTGAAQGIGRETALAFADRGVGHLVLLDVARAPLMTLAGELEEKGVRATCCVVDIRQRKEVRAMLKRDLRELGRLDILVNNAGVSDENDAEDVDGWLRVLDINLNGPFTVTAACLEHLSEGGRIINVSSILGRAGKIRNTAYCASKHGLLGYTKALALELAPRRITVNAILPGWIDTPLLQRELGALAIQMGAEPRQVVRNARKSIPLKRLVEAREAASLIAFLASDQAAAITAQSFTIDGGYTCGM
jgi:ketoreductase